MLRITAPTSVRKGSALVGMAGLLVLAGCAGTDGAGSSGADTASDSGATGGGDSSATYADGTYTADGSYQTPETVETISVTVTLGDGVVEDVEVTGDPQARETEQYQGAFIDGIAEEVVGKPLDELNVSRVAGSSLTSGGFNQAIESIKEQAAA
jgi:uncharacterized protein with FMN-binding domain